MKDAETFPCSKDIQLGTNGFNLMTHFEILSKYIRQMRILKENLERARAELKLDLVRERFELCLFSCQAMPTMDTTVDY